MHLRAIESITETVFDRIVLTGIVLDGIFLNWVLRVLGWEQADPRLSAPVQFPMHQGAGVWYVLTALPELKHSRASPLALLGVCLAAATVLLMPPIAGWPAVVRLSAVLLPTFVLCVLRSAALALATGDWDDLLRWEPSRRTIAIGASAAALFLFWIVYTRFQSGHINGVDFTIYFDRPLFQTSRGRPFFVEVSDQPAFSRLTHLAVHGYWILVPLGGVVPAICYAAVAAGPVGHIRGGGQHSHPAHRALPRDGWNPRLRRRPRTF